MPSQGCTWVLCPGAVFLQAAKPRNENNKSFYLVGRNGDLWQEVYDEINKLSNSGINDINFIKVKSHVTTQEDWDRYNMTAEMYIFNALADEAASIASKKLTNFDTIKQDSNYKHEVVKIARRLAAIEESIWTDNNDFKKFHGKSFDQLKQQRTEVLKRKAGEALSNTVGGESHSLYVHGRWHRCRDCPAMALIKNLDYWSTKACTRIVKKATTDYMDKTRAGVERFLLHPAAE